jgi:hypothetical protein
LGLLPVAAVARLRVVVFAMARSSSANSGTYLTLARKQSRGRIIPILSRIGPIYNGTDL